MRRIRLYFFSECFTWNFSEKSSTQLNWGKIQPDSRHKQYDRRKKKDIFRVAIIRECCLARLSGCITIWKNFKSLGQNFQENLTLKDLKVYRVSKRYKKPVTCIIHQPQTSAQRRSFREVQYALSKIICNFISFWDA